MHDTVACSFTQQSIAYVRRAKIIKVKVVKVFLRHPCFGIKLSFVCQPTENFIKFKNFVHLKKKIHHDEGRSIRYRIHLIKRLPCQESSEYQINITNRGMPVQVNRIL